MSEVVWSGVEWSGGEWSVLSFACGTVRSVVELLFVKSGSHTHCIQWL